MTNPNKNNNTQKNIIDEVLNCFYSHPEAIEKFNKANEDWQTQSEDVCEFFNLSSDYEQKQFLLVAFSSPDGVPVCDFLDKQVPGYELILDGWSVRTKNTFSRFLYQTLCNCIEQGKSFCDIETILNNKYNELLNLK